MLKRKICIISLGIVVVLIIVSALAWQKINLPRQSSLRLESMLYLKQLYTAIFYYRKYYGHVPKDLETLQTAGMITNISNFSQFKYIGGFNGVFAFQNEPFPKVLKGEPWGGNGEVAKYEIPEARAILFADGSIKFIDELDFKKRMKYLLMNEWDDDSSKSDLVKKENITPEELIPGENWSEWYRKVSGYSPDPEHFGSYVTLPVGNELYIGLGTGLPTLGDGALVARFDGKIKEPIGSLAEEGIHEMIWDYKTSTLHIAGTDPSWPDDWSAGNHYTYLRGISKNIVKYRDPKYGLINVIHTWGLWLSEEQVLYAAVNSHDGSFMRDRDLYRRIFNRINSIFDDSYYSTDYGVTRMGRIFKSTDNGKSWHHLSNLGYFRAYDIIQYHDEFYAIYTNTPESPYQIAVSVDGAVSWKDITQLPVQLVNLSLFKDKLLAVSYDRKSIYSVQPDRINQHDLPIGFSVEPFFNVMANDRSYLYMVCQEKDGAYSILRTPDLREWEKVVSFNKKIISLSYWKDKNWLVFSDAGKHAKLWKVNLQGLDIKER